MDMINATGLVICNKGNTSSHNKGSIIDLTFATPTTARKMTRWEVIDKESLSDHYYILFEIESGLPSSQTWSVLKIDFKKLEALLVSDRLTTTLSG